MRSSAVLESQCPYHHLHFCPFDRDLGLCICDSCPVTFIEVFLSVGMTIVNAWIDICFLFFCSHDLAALVCLTKLWSRLFLTLLRVHVRTILLLCYCWFLYRCSSADMLAALLWLCRYSALKNLGYPATIWSMIFWNWPHILLTGSVPSLKILLR